MERQRGAKRYRDAHRDEGNRLEEDLLAEDSEDALFSIPVSEVSGAAEAREEDPEGVAAERPLEDEPVQIMEEDAPGGADADGGEERSDETDGIDATGGSDESGAINDSDDTLGADSEGEVSDEREDDGSSYDETSDEGDEASARDDADDVSLEREDADVASDEDDGGERVGAIDVRAGVAGAREVARTWTSAHRRATGALAAVAACAIVVGSFAIAINVTMQNATAGIQSEDSLRGYVAPVEDAELPHVAMRFRSLEDNAFPALVLNLHVSPPSGQEMPPLEPDDFTLRESDADQRTIDLAIGEFSLDPASGACRIGFNTDPAALGPDRKLVLELADTSGYRGKCSVSYRVPGM